jgi:hypothetical protein
MFIFGVLAFLFGVIGLVSPETLLLLLGFETIERAQRVAGDYTLTFVAASSYGIFQYRSVLRAGGLERHEKVLSLDRAISWSDFYCIYDIGCDRFRTDQVLGCRSLGIDGCGRDWSCALL